MNRDEIIAQMQEAKRFKEPFLQKKGLLLKQLKELSREIKKQDRTILYLANQLQEMREE